MELGGVPQKNEYFHLGPIFYVCSSARNWVSSMYKGIYHICNSLWRVATLDVWSSSTRTFQQKKQVPEMTNFFLYCIKKMSFLGSPKGTPHDWCRRTMKKNSFAMKTNGIGWCSSKIDEYFHLGPIFYVCSSARNWVCFMYKGLIRVYIIYVIPFGE